MRMRLTRMWSVAPPVPRSVWMLLVAAGIVSALGVQAAGTGGAPGDTAIRLESIAGRVTRGTVAVLIQSSEPAPYVTTQPDPLTVLIELRNVTSAGFANRFAGIAQQAVAAVSVEDTTSFDGAPMTRVKVRMAGPVTPRIRSDRNVIRVEVDETFTGAGTPLKAASPPTAEAEKPVAAGQKAPEPPQPSLAKASDPLPLAAVSLPPLAQPRAPQPVQQAVPPPAAQQASAQNALSSLQSKSADKQYTGAPISLDFTGADIRQVLRSFVDFSGLNIIFDQSIQGTVDIALRDVPWDQALEIILRNNGLGYTVDGTVVRIAPLKILAEEESQRRKLAEEQAAGATLETMTRTLNYATAEEMKSVLQKSNAVTKYGMVETDKRTNTLIVRDIAASLPTVTQIIDTLDKPQPQVEIEARIIQTSRIFAKQLGVQWGFSGRVDPALGNTTPLAFPNQGSISGRTGASGGGTPSAVNLGTTEPPTAAVGLSMGAVNGAFNLDIALSALEKTGQGRILSTPRVLAQNNIEAKMVQGVQIPIQTIANNTVTVQFKDAALKLVVTPQITANNTVIMKISVENASPDYTKQVNNMPPINTQQAETQVLVKDNETIVIGGVYVSAEQTQNDRTPGLHRIPLLGWLFRRDTINDEAKELLIFITPRIMKG